jgi:hypothetical protein
MNKDKELLYFFHKFDLIVSNLKNFIEACEIKEPPLTIIR